MSSILDLIFPRPYDVPNFYSPVFPQAIKYFPGQLPDTCLSLFKYTGIIRQTIIDLKYNFVSDISLSLINFSLNQIKTNFPHLLSYWHRHQFILIPIPLHPHRFNWRGFNQTACLGSLISSGLGLRYADVLYRSRPASSWFSPKDKTFRSRNLKNVFALRCPPPSKHVLLFDDIATTNSTFRAAAATFKKIKITSISALAIAG